MSSRKNQSFWVPSGATVRLPPRMRLAPAEYERLWNGLERFVNCGDSERDYAALSRAFPDFWPAEIWHYPNQKPDRAAAHYDLTLGKIGALSKGELSEADLKQMKWESQKESLNWHAACHRLFLFYRDTLREVWCDDRPLRRSVGGQPTLADLAQPSPLGWLGGRVLEFLMSLTDLNEEALQKAKNGEFNLDLTRPFEMDYAWEEIVDKFPTAAVEGRVEIGMLWRIGDFSLVPNNDFQRALYLVFRQSWRARVCPRCKMFFVARKPKQIFCGTGCSAGNRLASKRKWWKRVGAKLRAERQGPSKRIRRERENR
jgi:hypothetical protein